MGHSRAGGIVTSQFELEYLPDPNDERTRWALAFYRLSLDHYNVAYAALSFFKILNIVANTGQQQKALINANLVNFGMTNLVKFEINQRLEELRNSGTTDIGEYLYKSGRCAIAHAGPIPTVDPENPEDIERLSKDLPLIRAVAAYVIEKELGIKSRHTIWDEHLYELAGFQELVGRPVATRLKEKTTVRPDEIAAIRRIHVRIKNHSAYLGLENLTVRNVAVSDGIIRIMVAADNGLVEIDLTLDFPDERINFDLATGLRVKDDGSERGARQIISVLHFIVDYLSNGKLHVYNAETDALLGRKDAYIPTNIDFSRTHAHYNQLIERYEAEAKTRAVRTQAERREELT
jgi:hypothetical protein